ALKALLKDPDIIQVRFEELIQQPQKILREILDSAGLPWHERVLQHHLFSPNDVDGIPWLVSAYEPLKSATKSERQPDSMNAWIELLCPSAFRHHYQKMGGKRKLRTLFREIFPCLKSIAFLLRISTFPPQSGEQELKTWLSHNPAAFKNWPDFDLARAVSAQLASHNG
ncbi:MAG: hypothetical protein AAF483_28565, partial [Planctomycetota bacterium]